MLEVKNLTKTYATKQGPLYALDDVSVTVNKGEIFGFIGLSGAGKTSLARCISALEKADHGEILLAGEDITRLKGRALRETRKKMGLVFQHFNLLMNSTVFENVAFPLRIARKNRAYISARVNELLELVGLTEKADAYPATLSGGQKQRVGIARALATEPELVICDEATSALDPDTTKSILSLLKQISVKTGVTLIVITHEMDVIRDLCTHVAIMEGGKIIELGPVLDVLTQPVTPTGQRFFVSDYIDPGWFSTNARIFRAIFVGDAARKSFINDVIKRFDINISILSGNIESIGGTMVGNLILEISGDDNVMEEVRQFFHDSGVKISELEAQIV